MGQRRARQRQLTGARRPGLACPGTSFGPRDDGSTQKIRTGGLTAGKARRSGIPVKPLGTNRPKIALPRGPKSVTGRSADGFSENRVVPASAMQMFGAARRTRPGEDRLFIFARRIRHGENGLLISKRRIFRAATSFGLSRGRSLRDETGFSISTDGFFRRKAVYGFCEEDSSGSKAASHFHYENSSGSKAASGFHHENSSG